MSVVSLMAVAVLALRGQVVARGAQAGVPPSPEQVQVSFGYKCGNEFLLRNDAAIPLDLELQVEGRAVRAKVHLNVGAVLAVKSSASAPLDLLINGMVVASAAKGNVSCGAMP